MDIYSIKEDKATLLLYFLLILVLSTLLMMLAIFFYMQSNMIVVFFVVSGIWYAIKALYRYGRKLFIKKPICRFENDGIYIQKTFKKGNVINYTTIKKVKILKDRKSLKLFFAGDWVTHPSGWDYLSIACLFHHGRLVEVQEAIEQCLIAHHVSYCVVHKA